jgi:excisionase family DNA binding protein
MSYTLGTAARATGVSKSTIYRAIKAGRVSASRTDTGDYAIDPAELHRVFPPSGSDAARSGTAGMKRGATEPESGELALKAARLEAEIAASALVSELLRRQLDETRQDRDHWRGQAQRLVAPLPPPRPSPAFDLGDMPARSGFMSRLFGRA